MKKCGKVTVIVGPMYSGKTTELLTFVEIYKLGKKKFKVFKPIIDDRYGKEQIQSHSGMKVEATPISHSSDSFRFITDHDAVFFDEIQFFDSDLSNVVKKLRKDGKDVICAGLDMSFKENPFDTTAKIMCIADKVVKKKAVCHECGEHKGIITYKLEDDDSEIDVGGMEKYVAVCIDCYKKLHSGNE